MTVPLQWGDKIIVTDVGSTTFYPVELERALALTRDRQVYEMLCPPKSRRPSRIKALRGRLGRWLVSLAEWVSGEMYAPW